MKLSALLTGLALAACAESLTGPLGPSSWGGTGIQLGVTPTAAHAEFDCGSADVATTIYVSKGSFVLQGFVTVGHGGPVMQGVPPDIRPATFSGTVSGDQMSLDVVVSGTSTAPGYSTHYELTRGVTGVLHRCL